MADIEQAIQDFLKADRIEKEAKNLREAARVLLLREWEKQGRPETLDPRINITVPVKKATDSRFDQARAMEAYNLIEDALGGDVVNGLFEFHPQFRGPEVTLAVAKTLSTAQQREKLSKLLAQFIIPGEPETAMTPRVGKA